MLGEYKALIVILSIGFATFWLAAKTLPVFIPNKTFRYWRNIWFAVVIAAFFSHNVWLFFGLIILGVIVAVPTGPSPRITYYFLLVCILPEMPVIIPGFAGIKTLFVISYPRLLVIALFLSTYLTQRHNPRLFSLSTDRYIVAFLFLIIILNFRDSSFTNALRESFLIFIDIFIPYFIISRYITSLEEMNRALFALFISLAFLAVVGTFESFKHWLVYSELRSALFDQGLYYDIRAGGLRSTASFSGPIVLGYVMVIGFGILLYLKPFLRNKNIANLAGGLIIACLLSTMARGPWLGLALLIIAYIWTGRAAIKGLIKIVLLIATMIPLLSITSFGQKLIDLLPFIGTTRSDTIDYRQRLVEHAWIVVQRQPWFGSPNYRETPEMEAMRQGQGIIDVVNSYIHIILSSGIIGLLLFLAIFFSLLFSCHKKIKQLSKEQVDLIRMGRVLFATLSSVLFMIFTVSSINYIPIFYWLLAGITAAYINLATQALKADEA